MSLEIIKGIEKSRDIGKNVVATIGTFDGLHRGHQEIIRHLMDASRDNQSPPIAITFEPHPRVLVTPDEPPLLLSTWEEKVHLFSKYMQGTLLVLEFNRQLMNLTAEEFVREFLIEKLNLKRLIVGYDHAFGKNRSGTINDLMELSQAYGFTLDVVNPVIVGGRPISSSRIRRLIANHNLSQALEMLGHPYPIAGKIEKGIGLGKKIGYPTANISLNSRKLLPTEGVYSCRAEYNGDMYRGMMFIGQNNFNPEQRLSVEVNLFDFERDIYNQTLICYPELYIRENRKYNKTEDLVGQLSKDKENIMKLFDKGDNSNGN